MKNKYITDHEYFDNILPGTQISFGTVSPFAAINFPPNKTAFVAWYGNTSFGSAPSIVIGTLEACRHGDGTVVYDFDRYPIYTTGTTSIYEIVVFELLGYFVFLQFLISFRVSQVRYDLVNIFYSPFLGILFITPGNHLQI